jgi:phosphate transport system substrate-binding protein
MIVKNIIYLISLSFLVILFTQGCANVKEPADTLSSGKIAISVDETYKPIFEEAIKIFESNNPNAKINASYKPEADCIEDFIKDTTRIIFVTRKLSDNEKQRLELNKAAVTRELELARDAVAFVVAKGSKSEFTQTQFTKILEGAEGNYQLVVDNEKSSTRRYIQDSILKGKPMSKNIFAVKNADELLTYIQKNKNAIGAIGVNWVADPNDSTASKFNSNIEVVGILPYNDSLIRFRKPMRHYIGLKEYPYIRNLMFISKEAYAGLGTGFANFLGRLEGQLLFSQANFFPLTVDVNFRAAVSK